MKYGTPHQSQRYYKVNELVIYSATCLTCRHRAEMQQIRQFAHKHNLTVVTKRTNYSREHRDEAIILNAEQPFIYLNNKVLPFKGVTSGALEELVQ